MEHPYNLSKNIFILDKSVFIDIIQYPELDLDNIGKIIFEYNFSESTSLSFDVFI